MPILATRLVGNPLLHTKYPSLLSPNFLLQSKGKIAPLPGSLSRYKVDAFVVYVATKLNCLVDELQVPGVAAEFTETIKQKLNATLRELDQDFQSHPREFAASSIFTIADIYLFCVMGRLDQVEVAMGTLVVPNLIKYLTAIAAREDIKQGLASMNGNPCTTYLVEENCGASTTAKLCAGWC